MGFPLLGVPGISLEYPTWSSSAGNLARLRLWPRTAYNSSLHLAVL